MVLLYSASTKTWHVWIRLQRQDGLKCQGLASEEGVCISVCCCKQPFRASGTTHTIHVDCWSEIQKLCTPSLDCVHPRDCSKSDSKSDFSGETESRVWISRRFLYKCLRAAQQKLVYMLALMNSRCEFGLHSLEQHGRSNCKPNIAQPTGLI